MSVAESHTPVRQVLECAHPAVRHLSVEETVEAVIISGRVSCYYHKQLAQECLLRNIGSRTLVNRVAVECETERSDY